MKVNTACITLEDLEKLYADRERLCLLNETMYHMAAVLRQHLAGPYDCWTREIGGFELKNHDDLIEEMMAILFNTRPSFKEIMEKEAERIRTEAEAEALRIAGEDQEGKDE